MDPHLAKNDTLMFYKYLDMAHVYFEFGSGGSTYQASIRPNIKTIYSVESDIIWHKKLKNIISTNNVRYIVSEMDTQPNTWGHPGKRATIDEVINYSTHMKNLDQHLQHDIDLIFIDGRFRVACCLKCHDIMNDDCVIIFDDFINRPHYHVVLEYFNIIEKTIDNRMVVLKKKVNISVPKEVVSKYELIKE